MGGLLREGISDAEEILPWIMRRGRHSSRSRVKRDFPCQVPAYCTLERLAGIRKALLNRLEGTAE